MNGRLLEAGGELAEALLREVGPAVKGWAEAARARWGPPATEPVVQAFEAVSRAGEESAQVDRALSLEVNGLATNRLTEAKRSPLARLTEVDVTGEAQELRMDTLSGEELLQRALTEPENMDLFKLNAEDGEIRSVKDFDLGAKRLRYLLYDESARETHLTLSLGNRIVGIGGVQTNPHVPEELWVKHVSVEERHWGKGYARLILESIYAHALRNGQYVNPGRFEELVKS